MLLGQAPLMGVLLAMVSRADSLTGRRADATEARKLLFMLSTVGVWFGIINAAREVCKESAILRRERAEFDAIGESDRMTLRFRKPG